MEKKEDFEWAFRTFVEVISGVSPTTILIGK